MSWQDLAPAAAPPKLKTAHAVTLLVSKLGRFTQHATLTVRRDLMPPDMLGWWGHYEMVRVQTGDGPDAGRVRVMPGGPHRLTGPSGKPGRSSRLKAPHLKLYGLAGMPAVLGRQPVLWEMIGDTLIVTLPWSDAKGAAKAWPAATPANPPALLPVPILRPAPSLLVRTKGSAPMLTRLQAAGGGLDKYAIDPASIKVLRECQGAGLAEVVGDAWRITAKGVSELAAHGSKARGSAAAAA